MEIAKCKCFLLKLIPFLLSEHGRSLQNVEARFITEEKTSVWKVSNFSSPSILIKPEDKMPHIYFLNPIKLFSSNDLV